MKKKEKILVLGGSGFLGSYFCKLNEEFFNTISPNHSELDVLNVNRLNRYLLDSDASVVINFVALADVNKSEKEKGKLDGIAYKLNARFAKDLAKICRKTGKHLIQISTDCVFSGKKETNPYKESDKPDAINWYGQTKYFGEEFVKKSGCSYCIARIEMTYTSDLDFKGKNDFTRFFLTQLLKGHKVKAIENQKITPTYINDVAIALRQLIQNKAQGIFHIASTDWVTPFEFATSLAEEFGLDTKLVQPIKFGLLKNRSPRPKNPWLDVSKFQNKFGPNILHPNRESIKLFKNNLNYKNV